MLVPIDVMESNVQQIMLLLLANLRLIGAVSHAVPPRITSEPTTENWYRPNEPLQLICSADGSPPIRYSWLKDGQPVAANKVTADGTLFIDGANPDRDNGIYQCRAKNRNGTAVSVKALVQHAVQNEFPPLFQPSVNRPQVGQPLVLKCTPPTGQPQGAVYWAESRSGGKKSTERLKPVEYNERISSDYNGNLYFTNVQQSDGGDSVHFVCVVSNKALGLLVQGEDQVILPVSSTNAQTPEEPRRLMWANSSQPAAIKGQPLKMKCIFSGYPTPTVTWTYTGVDAIKRQLPRSGQELIIDRVDYSDAGVYQCSVNNSDQKHIFEIAVEAAPSWKHGRPPPTDVCAIEQQSVELQCLAEGKPSPTVTWFVNGDSASNNERTTIFGDTFRYSTVNASDTQVVQCNVSNLHGYLFVNIRLHVFDGNSPLAENYRHNTAGSDLCDVMLRANNFTRPSTDKVQRNVCGRTSPSNTLTTVLTTALGFLLFCQKQNI